MSWTSPRTWLAGEVVTAAIMNTYISDDFTYLYSTISGSYARVYNNAALPIPTGVPTQLTFNSERTDTAAYHSASSSDFHKLSVASTGTYRVGTNIEFAANSVGYRTVVIRTNSSSIIAAGTINTVNGVPAIININAEYTMTATGWFDVAVLQTSTSDLNVTASNFYSPEFWISRIA